MKEILDKILADPRYQKNILYGEPRRGHAEGSVAAHIAELEGNLEKMVADGLITDEYWKLKVLIHVHDSFKAEAKRDSPILDPQSHASLARKFLAEFTKDKNLLNIVQFHDLGYAVYKKMRKTGELDEAKLLSGLRTIQNIRLLLLFSIIDSCTASKGREMMANIPLL